VLAFRWTFFSRATAPSCFRAPRSALRILEGDQCGVEAVYVSHVSAERAVNIGTLQYAGALALVHGTCEGKHLCIFSGEWDGMHNCRGNVVRERKFSFMLD
jgi:hypothetical protein